MVKNSQKAKKPQWPQKGSQSVQNPQIWIAVIQGSRLMPILWLFVRFLKKAGGFAGPPALQWVYSILAFCRGQVKRRAPAVQTLPEELSVKRQILSIGQKNFFWPKLSFGTNSSIPLLWLSSEKWLECLLLRNIDLFFQGHFQCFGEKANFDHLDKFVFLDGSCRKKNIFCGLN